MQKKTEHLPRSSCLLVNVGRDGQCGIKNRDNMEVLYQLSGLMRRLFYHLLRRRGIFRLSTRQKHFRKRLNTMRFIL
jgi:hypothetical protein